MHTVIHTHCGKPIGPGEKKKVTADPKSSGLISLIPDDSSSERYLLELARPSTSRAKRGKALCYEQSFL